MSCSGLPAAAVLFAAHQPEGGPSELVHLLTFLVQLLLQHLPDCSEILQADVRFPRSTLG